MFIGRLRPDHVREASASFGEPIITVPQLQSAVNASNASDLFGSLPDVTQLYLDNKEWAEGQAQKQMDYQTNANRIAMDFSAEQAAIQRAYETEMSNTAYQRVVEDLKKAGLNPVLAYQQGAAHVPSVSAASGISSSGAIATMADTGYGSYELGMREKEIDSREKIAMIAAVSQVLSTLINSAGDFAGSKTGKIGF